MANNAGNEENIKKMTQEEQTALLFFKDNTDSDSARVSDSKGKIVTIKKQDLIQKYPYQCTTLNISKGSGKKNEASQTK